MEGPSFPSWQPLVFIWKMYPPPTRRSVLAETRQEVAGPIHRISCSGLVHASKTRSRGALMKRVSFNVMFSAVAVLILVLLVFCFCWLCYFVYFIFFGPGADFRSGSRLFTRELRAASQKRRCY